MSTDTARKVRDGLKTNTGIPLEKIDGHSAKFMKTDISPYIVTAGQKSQDRSRSKEMPVPTMETSFIGVPEWGKFQG